MKRFVICFSLLLCIALQAAAQDLSVTTDAKGRKGYADASGKTVIACKYDTAEPFTGDIAQVSVKGKFGVVNRQGKLVIPTKYTRITPWTESLLLVSDGQHCGLFNHAGKAVLPMKYSFVGPLNSHGMAWLLAGGSVLYHSAKGGSSAPAWKPAAALRYGIVKADGSVVIPAVYLKLCEFVEENVPKAVKEGLAPGLPNLAKCDTLRSDCRYFAVSSAWEATQDYGMLDAAGKVLLHSSKASFLLKPVEGMARYYKENKGKTDCGYLNLETGKLHVVSQHTEALDNIKAWTHTDFHRGQAWVKTGNEWVTVDKDGRKTGDTYSLVRHYAKPGIWAKIKSGQTACEVTNEDDKPLFPATVSIENFVYHNTATEPLYPVCRAGKWGLIDATGATRQPFSYDDAAEPVYNLYCMKVNGKGWTALNSKGETAVNAFYKTIYFPTEYDPHYVWVRQTNDDLCYAYDLRDKQQKGNGYAYAYNFKGGYAFVVPRNFEVKEEPLNTFQLGEQYTTSKDKAGMFRKYKNSFGQVLNDNLEVQCAGPLLITHFQDACEAFDAVGKPFTQAQNKKLLLYLTRGLRSYPFLQNNNVRQPNKIDESQWDF